MNELVKVKSALTKKEKLEAWINALAQQGWVLHDFKYVLLGSMIYFRFFKGDTKTIYSCIYDLKWDDDEDLFKELGWNILSQCGDTVIFYQKDAQNVLPLLDMKLFTGRRIYKMSFNFIYVLALFYFIRIKNNDIRALYVFIATLILLSIPLLYGVKSTRKGNRLFRFLKNMVYAVLLSIVVCFLIETIIRAFYKLF